jgi:hypothetical protein
MERSLQQQACNELKKWVELRQYDQFTTRMVACYTQDWSG